MRNVAARERRVTEEDQGDGSAGSPDGPPAPRNVVICVGNAFRGDDAVALRAAAVLRARLGPEVAVIEGDGEPTGLLEAWDGADTVVVVDAVRTGSIVGTVVRRELGCEPLAKSARPPSSRVLGLAETIALAGALRRLPRRLIVWGVEARAFEVGTPPTLRVLAALPTLVRGVLSEFGQLPEDVESADA